VYIVGVKAASAAIDHVAPRVFYKGAYPTEPLSDTAHGDFSVDVVVHMTSIAATSGTLAVTGEWAGGSASVPVNLPAGASNVTVTLLAANNAVKLWWPAQTPGAQNLYNITATFTETGGAPKVATRRVGFRTFTLVTGNDTDPSTLAGKDGQDGFTMRFKVNGANIWSRGSNMIPMVRARVYRLPVFCC
jgi:beta-galactosidase/beta-glucuronidase